MGIWKSRSIAKAIGGASMQEYLRGYLDILPESERKKIEDVLKNDQVLISKDYFSENEFHEMINQLINDHKKLTVPIPQTEKVDSRKYNEFFGNLYIDLNMMFLESDLIESAIQNYDRLYEGVLSDLRKEIKSLEQKIQMLRLKKESENGTITKIFNFNTNTEMETDRNKYGHLFQDRDGSAVNNVNVIRNTSSNYVQLAKTAELDHLHGNGTLAHVEITGRRGTPTGHSAQNLYKIEKAIDNSSDTYWAELILVDEPMNVSMESNQEVYEAGGAYVELTITLNKSQVVNEISLAPFTKFPMEIVSIKYEEDIETYHVPKELAKDEYNLNSTETMTLSFPNILARRFTFVLRQKNYERNTYLIRNKELENIELWQKISSREADVTLDLGDGVESTEQDQINQWTGWDIYMEAIEEHRERLQAHKKELVKYKEDYAAYSNQVDEYNQIVGDYLSKFNYWKGRTGSNESAGLSTISKSGTSYTQLKSEYEQRLAEYERYSQETEEGGI